VAVSHPVPNGGHIGWRNAWRVIQRWKTLQVGKRALNELVASFRNPRRWRNHKSTAQNIDRHISARPNQPALARVAYPGLKVPAAAPRDNSRLAMSIDRVGQHSLVCGIDIKPRHAASPAAHEADGRRVGELAGDFGAADQTKLAIAADHRSLVDVD